MLILVTTGVLVGVPTVGWVLTRIRRARKMAQYNLPREQLPLPKPKSLWMRDQADPEPVKHTTDRFAQSVLPAERRTDQADNDTPLQPASSSPPSDSHLGRVSPRKASLLRTGSMLASAPLAMRLRLITTMEALVEDLHHETTQALARKAQRGLVHFPAK